MTSSESAVAFFIFNRPAITEKVFAAIRQARPRRLLIVADGARSIDEQPRVEATRAVVEKIDWNCEVTRNYADDNMGCKRRVSSGLSWVFDNVDRAIILEDDCLPTPSFFSFCDALLEFYRNDERVMHISGTSFQDGIKRSEGSYYFSKYPNVWGWASWRRAWKFYNAELGNDTELLQVVKSQCPLAEEELHWFNNFSKVANGEIDTWDYQWVYACWAQHGLAVVPETNLISNLGFGADATHTFDANSFMSQMAAGEINELRHPQKCFVNLDADVYVFRKANGFPAPKRTFASRLKSHVSALKADLLRTVKGHSNI